MHYRVIIKQKGEGCDYTVGCGLATEDMDLSSDLKEASIEANKRVEEDYDGGECCIESVHLVPLDAIHDTNYESFRDAMQAREAAEQAAEDEEKERAEFERLKEKFGG